MIWTTILGLLLLGFFPLLARAKYIEGHLNTREDWHFLARFCFLSDTGRLQFEFEFPQVPYEPQNILLYFDEPDQWPAVYKSGKNCWQKEAVLNPENNQIVYLTEAHFWSGCSLNQTNPEKPVYKCRATRSFSSRRERWWFVAASKCEGIESCVEKESPPHIKPENNQKIILHHDEFWSGCEVMKNNTDSTGGPMVVCKAGRSFYSARERWWFIAASRCTTNSTIFPGLNLKYKMWMTNGDDFWHKHFSADEFYILQTNISYSCFMGAILLVSVCVAYILPVDIAFLIAMVIILAISVKVAFTLKSRQLFHTTYKMYMVSLCLDCFFLFIMCIAYGKYANDGKDVSGLKTFGRIAEACSILTFLLMLILMGKGYTITRGRLSTGGSIKIAVFMTLYAIVYAVLFIYEAAFFDPGEVLYLYESPAGYGLIAMRLIGWMWFCYAIFFTLKHYPEKSKFYYPFFIFYTIWFWASPCTIFIANFGLPKSRRMGIVNFMERTVAFLGFGFYLILTRPSAANTNFPYHVRTSQIGVMNVPAQNGAPFTADKDTESFSPHPYAAPPEYTANGHPNFTELFTVSQSRSSQPNGNYPPTTNNNNTDPFPHQSPSSNPFIVTQ